MRQIIELIILLKDKKPVFNSFIHAFNKYLSTFQVPDSEPLEYRWLLMCICLGISFFTEKRGVTYLNLKLAWPRTLAQNVKMSSLWKSLDSCVLHSPDPQSVLYCDHHIDLTERTHLSLALIFQADFPCTFRSRTSGRGCPWHGLGPDLGVRFCRISSYS